MARAAQKPKDILDEMTRDELVSWMRSQFWFRLPKRSDVLFMRWERESAVLMAERDKENRSLDGVDFAERDRLAGQFNASTSPEEKLALLHKIKPYDDAMMSHIDRSRKLDKRQAKIDNLYKQYETESKKEAQ